MLSSRGLQVYSSLKSCGYGLRQNTQVVSTSVRLFASAAAGLDRKLVEERILNVLKDFAKINKDKLSPEAHFANDLGLDSLDTVEVVMAFEEEFGIEIPDAEADKIQSTADAITYISAHPTAK